MNWYLDVNENSDVVKSTKIKFSRNLSEFKFNLKKQEDIERLENKIKEMIADGSISGGMIPKVNSCISAIEHGIENVLIINGTIKHSILLELFTDSGIGTMVTKF